MLGLYLDNEAKGMPESSAILLPCRQYITIGSQYEERCLSNVPPGGHGWHGEAKGSSSDGVSGRSLGRPVATYKLISFRIALVPLHVKLEAYRTNSPSRKDVEDAPPGATISISRLDIDISTVPCASRAVRAAVGSKLSFTCVLRVGGGTGFHRYGVI